VRDIGFDAALVALFLEASFEADVVDVA